MSYLSLLLFFRPGSKHDIRRYHTVYFGGANINNLLKYTNILKAVAKSKLAVVSILFNANGTSIINEEYMK